MPNPLWVEYLALNRAAFEDFLNYITDLEDKYAKMAISALQKDELEKAKRIAGGLDMLSAMRLKAELWDKEQRAQAEHEPPKR